jgi:hypothetical protein
MNAIANSFIAQLATGSNCSLRLSQSLHDVKQNPQEELCAQLPIAFSIAK